MIRKNPDGKFPRIHPGAYVDPSAVVIGDVTIGCDVFIGPGAVIRADEPGSIIIIGDHGNVQDRVIMHALGGSVINIGERTSISHGAIIHGPCWIGTDCFVGFGSAVFKTEVGDHVFIKHLSSIENSHIPSKRTVQSNVSIEGDPGKLPLLSEEEMIFCEKVLNANLTLVKGYKALEPSNNKT